MQGIEQLHSFRVIAAHMLLTIRTTTNTHTIALKQAMTEVSYWENRKMHLNGSNNRQCYDWKPLKNFISQINIIFLYDSKRFFCLFGFFIFFSFLNTVSVPHGGTTSLVGILVSVAAIKIVGVCFSQLKMDTNTVWNAASRPEWGRCLWCPSPYLIASGKNAECAGLS